MGWRIDRDYLNDPKRDGIPSRVGTADWAEGMPQLSGPTFPFRLLDDDGEVYYHGIADAAACDEDEHFDGSLYKALKWAEADAGCTDLQVHPADAVTYGLSSREYAEGFAPEDWMSIFG